MALPPSGPPPPDPGIPTPDDQEAITAVRSAFLQLERALSFGDAALCRQCTGPALDEELEAELARLGAIGHRRIHGSMEITGASLLHRDVSSATVQIGAVSSICELDATNHVVNGSMELRHWSQDVSAEGDDDSLHGWRITSLGALHVFGPVVGGASPPMSPARLRALEEVRRQRLEQADAEHRRVMYGALHQRPTLLRVGWHHF